MSIIEECCNCSRIGRCSKTGFAKTLKSFTCQDFQPADEIELLVRSQMFEVSLVAAVRVILKRVDDPNQELARMSIESPAPGTPYSERKKQLEIMSFMDVRVLGNKKYKDQNGNPLFDWNDTLTSDKRESTIQRVLTFELANNIIVPDAAQQSSPQGAPAMASSPYQPPQMMPQMPMPSAPPAPPTPQAPYGMAPMQPPPGMPPPPNFPNAGFAPPPPVATPAQAAQDVQQPAVPAGGKKKRGAAAAPPPPPPPPNPAQAQQPMPFMQPPTAPPGFAPQAVQAPPAPAQFAPQQFAPPAPQQAPQAAAAVDLSPILAKIDAVGQAINAAGTADAKILAALDQLIYLSRVQVTCLHHIYMGQPHIAPTLAGKDVSDSQKFLTYIEQFLPR